MCPLRQKSSRFLSRGALEAAIDEARPAISDQRNELEAKPFLVTDDSLGRSPAPESNN
jgi:hypothetical protein